MVLPRIRWGSFGTDEFLCLLSTIIPARKISGIKAIVLGLDAAEEDYTWQQDLSVVLENIQEALQILHLTSCCSP